MSKKLYFIIAGVVDNNTLKHSLIGAYDTLEKAVERYKEYVKREINKLTDTDAGIMDDICNPEHMSIEFEELGYYDYSFDFGTIRIVPLEINDTDKYITIYSFNDTDISYGYPLTIEIVGTYSEKDKAKETMYNFLKEHHYCDWASDEDGTPLTDEEIDALFGEDSKSDGEIWETSLYYPELEETHMHCASVEEFMVE